MAAQESTDVFSLSDQVLSDRLHFVEEIGFGNWGSVWLCHPKRHSADGTRRTQEGTKIAVKLVHRSKTSTTAARVRSLWNEMKIVRTFKDDSHPSIIQFHSFIITPSYALITMTFLPTLIPVEVNEAKAKHWFRFLLSAVEFLHTRGVVHNDIKPANILISSKNVPVLVDFGFAERYDLNSKKAFHSDLSYGTPEYLSPERARGLPHDTRKSDIWSTGCTFFEILVGRTPFEYTEGEQFSTKADLEKYWQRTLRGKWVGTWKMSKGAEELLLRMMSPNADLRCTSLEAMDDDYWKEPAAPSTSNTTSSVAEMVDFSPSWELSQGDLDLGSPVGQPKERVISKSKSQPKFAATKPVSHLKKRAVNLSPIKASPPASPHSSATAKENSNNISRRIYAPRPVLSPLGTGKRDNNIPAPKLRLKPSIDSFKDKRRSKVLTDLKPASSKKDAVVQKDIVKDRVKEWERERQRLREMARLEEIERDGEHAQNEPEVEAEDEAILVEAAVEPERMGTWPTRHAAYDSLRGTLTSQRGTVTSQSSLPVKTPPSSNRGSFTLADLETSAHIRGSRSGNDLGLGHFRHSLKQSIDKTMRLYKSSLLTVAPSAGFEAELRQRDPSSWEDDSLIREADTSLPMIRHAIHNERVAADNNLDRMAIWMRNVERVVEETKLNFESSTVSESLPPVPLAPLSRSNSSRHPATRTSRLPRRVLAANRIFMPDADESIIYPATPDNTLALSSAHAETSQMSDAPILVLNTPTSTPTRPRRATVSTRSPEPIQTDTTFDIDTGSPSKRKEKSKSHGNLLQRHITPISTLELELLKPKPEPATSPRLSAVFDRSLFISPSPVPRSPSPSTPTFLSRGKSLELDHLSESPVYVEGYPARPASTTIYPVPDTPTRKTTQTVYDRYLASTGVKRLGLGYQSIPNKHGPVTNISSQPTGSAKRNFYSTRRAMPPPVSSNDLRLAISVDELGMINCNPVSPGSKNEHSGSGSFVRRALNAVINGKTGARRLSRAAT